MSGLALGLVLLGSLLHLGWNALAKQAEDKLAFLWLGMLPAALVGAVALTWEFHQGALTRIGILCIVGSGIVHALYSGLLMAAYEHADLSFVYPYSRGVGTLTATVGGVLLFADRPSSLGWIGIGLTIVAPLLEVVGGTKTDGTGRTGVLLTCATGMSIAFYVMIDKIGVTHVNPTIYLSALLMGPVILFAPRLMLQGRIRRELRISKLRPFVATIFMFSAYVVVLYALEIAPVSYVVAARASGIVASGLVGVWFLKERVSGLRWIGLGFIAVGVVCIGFA